MKKAIIAVAVSVALVMSGGSVANATQAPKDKTACVAAKASHASAKAAHVASKSPVTKAARKSTSAVVVATCSGK